MKPKLLSLALAGTITSTATAATIASYTFEGSTTSLAPTSVISGVNATDMGRSAYVNTTEGQFGNSSISNPSGGRAVFFVDSAAGVFGDDISGSGPVPGDASSVTYFTFTVTPLVGNTLNLENIGFDYQFGDTGGTPSVKATFSLRSSINGFAAADAIGFGNNTTGSGAYFSTPAFDLSAPEYQGLSDPVEFRIYLSDNSGIARTFRIDNVLLTGEVIPEPTSALLAALAAPLLLRRKKS